MFWHCHIIVVTLLATDLGRYIRKSAVRNPPPWDPPPVSITDLIDFLHGCYVVLFWLFFDWLWLTDWLFDWLIDFLTQTKRLHRETDLPEPPQRYTTTSFDWLVDFLIDWLTFWPKQKGYIARRTCQNRHRGTQRPFLIDWLTCSLLGPGPPQRYTTIILLISNFPDQ